MCAPVWAGYADTHQSNHQRPPGTWTLHHWGKGQNLCKGESGLMRNDTDYWILSLSEDTGVSDYDTMKLISFYSSKSHLMSFDM